jgi:hypothetical protein
LAIGVVQAPWTGQARILLVVWNSFQCDIPFLSVSLMIGFGKTFKGIFFVVLM